MKVLLAIILAAAALAVHAAAAEDLCRNGGFPSENPVPGLAKVGGGGRLAFLSDDVPGCPGEDAGCRMRSYVVPGDTVLTGRGRGPYVCAFFPGRGGGVAGWVRADRLTPVARDAAPPPVAWAGHWMDGDDTIDIKAKGTALEADGSAFWPSADPPLSRYPGGPNLGDFSGEARPVGNRAVFADDACRVAATLVGPFLAVADNGDCGGHNVRFDGVYRRQ